MTGRPPLSRRRKALLGLIVAGVFAFIAAVVLEVGLRVAGVGHSAGFWTVEKDASGQRWVRENRWVTAPFFAPELVRRPQPFRLSKRKETGAYRVFVLGSSAAMGDPEPSFSIARLLEVMLSQAYPKRRFEVVNAGITAVNSHVVRGMAADCAELEPDLFAIYEGNNEVIGPFGPGTVFTPVLQTPWAVRSAIALRKLRLGQLLARASRGWSRSDSALEDWGGMQMFLQHEIAADDRRLDATERLFEANLRAMVRAGRRAGATVVLGTVLTNQREFSPFRSRHNPALEAEGLARYGQALARGDDAFRRGDFAVAEGEYRRASETDPQHAEAHFRRGSALHRLGRDAEAKRELQQALDLDVLRFRTDSRLNQVIRRVALAEGDGVYLEDLVSAAEAESPAGIIGDELLYEHVHLTFRGAYVVARRLFEQVSADLVRRRLLREGEVMNPASLEELRMRLAFTTYEQAMITKELLARFQRPPFTAQSTNAQRISRYLQRDARAAQLLSLPESRAAISTIYENALTAAPDDWVLARNYGLALVANGEAARAKPLLLRALGIIPNEADTLHGLILAHRALGEQGEALKRLEELRRIEPGYPALRELSAEQTN